MGLLDPYQEPVPSTIRDLVKTVRKRTGLSQLAFAEKLGVFRQSITWWETGRRNPGAAVVRLFEILYRYPNLLDELKNLDLGVFEKDQRHKEEE